MSELIDSVMARRPLPWAGIVDIHTHLGEWAEFPIRGADADAMVAQMDRLGVAKMVCAHQACMTAEVVYGNDQVLAAMARHPGRILGYASAFPVTEALGLDEIRRCIDRGMSAVKLHNSNNIPYTSERYAAIWRYADERRLPVLLHTWGNLGSLTPVFVSYRNCPILLGHSGATAADEYVQYARQYPNVCLDLTGSASKWGLVEYFVRELGAERVVWGSDMPWLSQGQQLGKVVFADISEAEKRMILVDNPARILAGGGP